MTSVRDYIMAADIIKYRVFLTTTSNLNTAAWEKYLQDYPDQLLIKYIKFGFPLSITKGYKLNNNQVTNHFSARQFPKAVAEYLAKEVKLGAIVGPADSIQCAEYHCTRLLTRPKNGDKR